MKNAISWFEIPSTQLDQAQAFYETVLGCKMRREPIGPSEGEGGRIVLPRQALPPGMVFFARITDLDGNRLGLY